MARLMTEDELLTGITEAMTLAGWTWRHARRDDRALVMGHQGLPDLIAVHHTRGIALAWELKTDQGVVRPDQTRWIGGFRMAGIDSRIIRPRDYDAALRFIVDPSMLSIDDVRPPCIIEGCDQTAVRMLDGIRGLCDVHHV